MQGGVSRPERRVIEKRKNDQPHGLKDMVITVLAFVWVLGPVVFLVIVTALLCVAIIAAASIGLLPALK